MDDFALGLTIGAWLGCFIGIVIAALLGVNKEN